MQGRGAGSNKVLNSKLKKLKGNARWALLDRFTEPSGLE